MLSQPQKNIQFSQHFSLNFKYISSASLMLNDDMAVRDVWDTFFSNSVNQRLFKRKFIENLCCRTEWKMMKFHHLSLFHSLDFNCEFVNFASRNFMILILI